MKNFEKCCFGEKLFLGKRVIKMEEKKGFFGKLFGRKNESRTEEVPRRIEPKPIETEREEDQPGNRYKLAQKWREEQAMNEPLVKREQYKRKY